MAIPLPLDSSEYTDNLQTIFDTAIDTDQVGLLLTLYQAVTANTICLCRRINQLHHPVGFASSNVMVQAIYISFHTTLPMNTQLYLTRFLLPLHLRIVLKFTGEPGENPIALASPVEETSLDSSSLVLTSLL